MLRWFSKPQGRRTCPAAARLIALDGRVTLYRRRVKVAELMREHACHSVCRSDEFFIGQKVPAMSAAEELQLGQSYFLLPCHFFQSVLSFVEVASSLAGDGGRSFRHFDIHRTDAGKLQIRIAEEVLEGAREWEEEEERKRCNWLVCTTSALEKEYEQLVGWKSRQWRPKLDRIEESSEKKTRRGGGRRIGALSALMRKKPHKSVG